MRCWLECFLAHTKFIDAFWTEGRINRERLQSNTCQKYCKIPNTTLSNVKSLCCCLNQNSSLWQVKNSFDSFNKTSICTILSQRYGFLFHYILCSTQIFFFCSWYLHNSYNLLNDYYPKTEHIYFQLLNTHPFTEKKKWIRVLREEKKNILICLRNKYRSFGWNVCNALEIIVTSDGFGDKEEKWKNNMRPKQNKNKKEYKRAETNYSYPNVHG